MTNVTLKFLQAVESKGMEGELVVSGCYRSIMNQVQNPNDWKGPIDYRFHRDACAYDFDVIRHAVVHFTGNPDCVVTVEADGYVRVKSAGYRAGPCGG